MLHGCPHDLCGFKVGRLTPCFNKVPMSAKDSRFKREISAPLSGLLACPVRIRVRDQSVSAASPRPRPPFVRGRAHSKSTTWPRTCPCPVSELTATAIYPWPCQGDVQVVAQDLTGPRPGNSLEASKQRRRIS